MQGLVLLGCVASLALVAGVNVKTHVETTSVVLSETRFLSLGSTLLQYQTPSGYFLVWDFPLEAVGKCNPFATLPRVTGEMDIVGQLVSLGGNRVLYVDTDSETFEIMLCSASQNRSAAIDTSGLGGGLFSCNPLVNASLSAFSTGLKGTLAFTDPEFLLEFDSSDGNFVIHRLKKAFRNDGLPGDCTVSTGCGVVVESSSNLEESLANLCHEDVRTASPLSHYRVVGLLQGFLIQCRHRPNFVYAMPFPLENGTHWSLGPVSAGSLQTLPSVIALDPTRLLAYDPDTLDFEILQCTITGCSRITSGSLLKALPCAHATMGDCLRDQACGFCVDTGTCQQVGVSGPCLGTCHKWLSHSSLEEITERELDAKLDEEQLAFIGGNMVARFVSSLGFVAIHKILESHPNHRGRCPTLSDEPIYSTLVPYNHYVVSPFEENAIIFHDPRNGQYVVWRCKFPATPTGTLPPCGVSAEGVLPQTVGSYWSLIPSGPLTLVFNPATAELSMFHKRQSAFYDGTDVHTNIFEEAPTFSQRHAELANHRLLSLGHGKIMDLNKVTGQYRVWLVDVTRGQLIGPTSSGFLPGGVSQSIAWMGDDRLLSVSSADLAYLLVRFDDRHLPNHGPLTFTTIGRGSLRAAMCEYKSCSECVLDSSCGWCASTGKCLPGNFQEPCATNERCVTYTYGYCAAQPCDRLATAAACAQQSACGWCPSEETCVPQKNGAPLFGSCAGVLVGMTEE